MGIFDVGQSLISFSTNNLMNWKIFIYVFIQTFLTYNLSKKWFSSVIVFLYTFLVFTFLLCPCPLNVWYKSYDIRLTTVLIVTFAYALYMAIIPFYYPRKQSSYYIFQLVTNLIAYYGVFFFFYFYFCSNYSNTNPDVPVFFNM